MPNTITLIGNTAPLTQATGLTPRSATPADIDALARLYFNSYDTDKLWSQQDAKAEIDNIITGHHGPFYPQASPLIEDENGRIIAAALTLQHRTDKIGPDNTPTIYQIFTSAARRREGLAEKLIRETSARLHAAGHPTYFVHIDNGNAAALALYLTLGFTRWFPTQDDPF